jgi:hypothetical protein
MKYLHKLVEFVKIIRGENPRLAKNLNLGTLVSSIEENGLLEPITVTPIANGEFLTVRGHRRGMAIGELMKRNPKRFNELFGKGVPALVLSDVTEKEIVLLKLDHSDQQNLSDPYELQHSANMLFAIEATESEVANRLAGMIDRISPMKASAVNELNALKLKVEEAKKTGNDAAVILASQEVEKFVATYRRGFVQGLHNIQRCPVKVMHALYKRSTGENPEGVTEVLPALTTADITELWKAHSSDLEIRENGLPKYNKELNGPLFTEKWDKLVAKAAAPAEAKVEKSKAATAKALKEEVDKGKYMSKLAVTVTQHHAGDAEATARIPELDKAAYHGDLVRQHDEALWATVVKAAGEITQRLIAASKAKAAAKAEAVKPEVTK